MEYKRIELDAGLIRDFEEVVFDKVYSNCFFLRKGDETVDAVFEYKFNNKDNDTLYSDEMLGIDDNKGAFQRVFIKNIAQTGKKIVLFVYR